MLSLKKKIVLVEIFFNSHLPKKENCVICPVESLLKSDGKCFYFILKTLFVLKMFKFLS